MNFIHVPFSQSLKLLCEEVRRSRRVIRPGSVFLFLMMIACNPKDQRSDTVKENQPATADSLAGVNPPVTDTSTYSKIYSNERFRDVTVTRKGDHSFQIKGQAQIFEANFGWVVEDGHNELLVGHQMTDAGAPEWGNFSFTIEAVKENPNSTLHLILFESSPKDGTRQYELPILLY